MAWLRRSLSQHARAIVLLHSSGIARRASGVQSPFVKWVPTIDFSMARLDAGRRLCDRLCADLLVAYLLRIGRGRFKE
jgi:hypothetical protein